MFPAAQDRKKRPSDPAMLRQLLFIYTFSIIGFSAVSAFGVLHILAKNYYIGLPEVVFGCIFLLNILILRIRRDFGLAKNVMLTTLGFTLILQLITGGTEQTGIYWFATFPLAAFFLTGRRNGIIWTLILGIAILLTYNISMAAHLPFAYSFIEIRQLLISLFVIGAIVNVYQNFIEETEASLETEKVKDEALLASIGEGMVAIDNDGKILVMNHIAQEMLGLQHEHVIGKDYTELAPMKDMQGNVVPRTARLWQVTLNKKEKTTGEYIMVRKDNSEFPISLVMTPVTMNDKGIGTIGLFRDITEEKALDHAKSEFMALASHQLRTPISAIGWFTEMLLNGDSGKITEEQRDQLTQIYQSNQRMVNIVTALLYVSQLEMGSVAIKTEPVDLGKLSHTILQEEMEKFAEKKKITIEEQYDEKMNKVSVDPDVMKVIFQNLFSNAIKYTPNGKISVSITSAQPKDAHEKPGIVFQVKDTGVGIPKKQQEKIFTKMFRTDNAKALEPDGTGLGLYLAKSLMTEAGGKVWFTSEEGKGSTFFVWLPQEGMKDRNRESKRN
jgi:PAS domain S-box-containing protein